MSDIIKNAFDNLDSDNEKFISKNLSIVEEVYRLMEVQGLTQKDFAKLLGKNESEISKWLSGLQNLTLRSIAKMEVALGEDLIITCSEAKRRFENVDFKLVELESTQQNDLPFNEIEFENTAISEQETEVIAA